MNRVKESLKKYHTILNIYVWFLECKESIQHYLYLRFAPIHKTKIVFDSFRGRGFGDNPKAIAEEIIRQGLDWDLVWLTNKQEEMPAQIRQVEYFSKEAMKELATAKMWVFDCRNVNHPEKRKKQVYLQTWHGGFPFKFIEKEAQGLSEYYVNAAKKDGSICDAIISACGYMSQKYKDSFWINDSTQILEFGEPKNDVLFDKESVLFAKRKVCTKYSIHEHCGVILYMPTFRDDKSNSSYQLDGERVIKTLEIKDNKEYILLFRLHSEAEYDSKEFNFSDKVIDVSDYPVASDLICTADYIISDYSSIIIPSVMLHKPVFIFACDIEEYKKARGLNSLYDKLPCKKSKNNNELIQVINEYRYEDYFLLWKEFIVQLELFDDGKASKRTVEWIKAHL